MTSRTSASHSESLTSRLLFFLRSLLFLCLDWVATEESERLLMNSL